MQDFSNGVRLEDNEQAYQAALREYGEGWVLSLNRSRKGRYTLHKATCGTLYYDLVSKGQHSRSGKILFRDHAELDAWLSEQSDLGMGNLNRCSRCT